MGALGKASASEGFLVAAVIGNFPAPSGTFTTDAKRFSFGVPDLDLDFFFDFMDFVVDFDAVDDLENPENAEEAEASEDEDDDDDEDDPDRLSEPLLEPSGQSISPRVLFCQTIRQLSSASAIGTPATPT